MPHHRWGDDWFEKNGDDLCNAISYCIDFWKRWGRIGSHGKEKYGCYDEQTKILTKNGWKYFKDIDTMDEFATLQKNNKIEYHKATYFVKKPYNGKMYHINTRGIDLLVTPNHNLYCAKGDINGGVNNSKHKKYSFELQNYKNLFRKPKKFIKGGVWEGISPNIFTIPEYSGNKPDGTGTIPVHLKRVFPIKPWLAFLGWAVSEGCVQDYQLSICLNNIDNGKEKEHVVEILKSLELPFSERITQCKSSVILNIYSVQLCNWLEQNIGRLAPNKKVPNFIKELSPDLIKIFLINLYMGDGNKTKTANILSTVSEKLAENCLELLLKAGYCGKMQTRNPKSTVYNDRIIKGNYKEYTVNWLKNIYHHSSNSHDTQESIEKKEQLIDYNGNVYCVEVPGHVLYVCRNGKPVWCGNTFRDHPCFWDGGIWSLLRPGYVYVGGPFLQFLYYKIDLNITQPFTKYTGIHRLGLWWQAQVYNYAIQKMCKKYPNIIDELVADLDAYELVKPGIFGPVDGVAINGKYWVSCDDIDRDEEMDNE